MIINDSSGQIAYNYLNKNNENPMTENNGDADASYA